MKPKVVLITGTSRGIGKAIADSLRSKGHIVYGSSRQASDTNAYHLQLDVTDPQSCGAVIDTVVQREGRLDVLINNVAHHLVGAHEETSLDEIKHQFDVNFFGAVHMMKSCTPAMLQQRSGMIINMVSTPGEIGFPYMAAYTASKFALDGYAESLRMELKPFGISVANILPAGVKTGTTDMSVRRPEQTHPMFESASADMYKKLGPGHDESMSSSLEAVVKAVEMAMTVRDPVLRYRVGIIPKIMLTMKALRSQNAFERFVMKQMGAPTKAPD